MESTKQHSRQRTAKEMFPKVEAYLRGSLSKSKFCKAQGINIHTFTYWHQKYKAFQDKVKEKPVSNSKLISLEVSPPPHAEMLEMCYPNGVRLRLPAETKPDFIQTLLQLRV